MTDSNVDSGAEGLGRVIVAIKGKALIQMKGQITISDENGVVVNDGGTLEQIGITVIPLDILTVVNLGKDLLSVTLNLEVTPKVKELYQAALLKQLESASG